MTRIADAVRRAVDVVAAIAGLVLLSPVLAGAAIAVRINLGPGVIHSQIRLGRGGRPIRLLKFRTMRHAAPGRDHPEFDAERLTRVGSWLRSSSIDELPSLVNMARGDISLVGPRPLPQHYWERFRGAEFERFLVRPGLSGLAQVQGRNELPWDDRLRADVRYVRTRSLRGDALIVARTLPMLLGRVGITEPGGVTMTPLPASRVADDPGYVDVAER